MPLAEAAASWYDNVYTPIAKVIRKHRVLEQLPGWTEADVYVEITKRWLQLSEEGAPAGPDPAVQALLGRGSKKLVAAPSGAEDMRENSVPHRIDPEARRHGWHKRRRSHSGIRMGFI